MNFFQNKCFSYASAMLFLMITVYAQLALSSTNSVFEVERLATIIKIQDEQLTEKNISLACGLKATLLVQEGDRPAILSRVTQSLGVTNVNAIFDYTGGLSAFWQSIIFTENKLYFIEWEMYGMSTNIVTRMTVIPDALKTNLIEKLMTLTRYPGYEKTKESGGHSDPVYFYGILYRNGKRVHQFATERPDPSVLKTGLFLSKEQKTLTEVMSEIWKAYSSSCVIQLKVDSW